MNAPIEFNTIDCRGMQCPAPILQIAKSSRKAAGTPVVLEVLADDHDFPGDVEAWCRTTKSTILKQEDGDFFRVFIGLNGITSMPPVHGVQPTEVEDYTIAQEPPTTLDLRGLSSSTALMHLSARMLAAPEGVLQVTADGENFTADAYAWASATKSQISNLQIDGAEVRMEVRPAQTLGAEAATKPPSVAPLLPAPISQAAPVIPVLSEPTLEDRCTLLVLHNDFEALMAAMMVANAAAAQGLHTQIFFSFWGVNLLRDEVSRPSEEKKPSLMQRMMKWMMPAGPERQSLGQMNFGGVGMGMMSHLMKKNNVLSLAELMDTAADMDVEFVACTMSMGLMGIQKCDLAERSNLNFGGVTSFVEAAQRSRMSMVF